VSGSAPSTSAAARGPRLPRAKQSLGQNFLKDEAIARRLVGAMIDEPSADDGGRRVLELGPGQGALTCHLLERYPRMTAFEIDERMFAVLRDKHPELDVELADMLSLDLLGLASERGGRLSLVSNTPFYLTSPLLYKLCASIEGVRGAVLTVQSEVADRLLSPPRSKQYGILSVMLQLFGQPERLFEIPPEAFSPAPKVTTAALRLTPTAVPPGETEACTPSQRAALLALLKLTFEMRRKMLRKSLRPLLDTGEYIERPPADLLAQRPEELDPATWLALARMLFGEDLGEAGERAGGERPGRRLERHHTVKSWKAHKAGYGADSD